MNKKIIIAAQYKVRSDIWGGMDEFFLRFCRLLAERGLDPVVALPEYVNTDASRYRAMGIPHVLLKGELFFLELVNFCRRNPSRLVHTHFVPVLTRHFLKLRTSTDRIITTEHMPRPLAGWTWLKTMASRFSAAQGAKAVSVMVHVSKYLENENRLTFGSCVHEKSIIIYNGVRHDVLHRSYPGVVNEQQKLRLISAGRLVFEKGFSDLIRVTKRLLERYGNIIQLDILGDGPLRSQLETEAGDELGKSIFFRGYVNDVRHRYRQADLYVHCASQEAFAFVFLEAGEAGLPVVTYDVGGNREAVIDGFNGFLVPAHDIDKFVTRCSYFIEEVGELKRFGENSRNLVQSSFTVDKMVENYIDLYSRYIPELSK